MIKLVGLAALLCMNCAVFAQMANAALKVEVYDYKSKTIYHSPETPGYTSWVGLWQLPDGTLQCDFRQLTGPKDKTVSTCPMMESKDEGKTWKVVATDRGGEQIASGYTYFSLSRTSGRGMAVLPDWTMVRPVWPLDDMKESGYTQRSTDRGKTWGKPVYFMPVEEYRCWPTLIKPLKDGRLALFAGCQKRFRGTPTSGDIRVDSPLTKMMFVSADKGKSWGKPIVLVPYGEGGCEESDFCELDNGDLLWVHRSEHLPDHQVPLPFGANPMGPTPPASYWYSDRQQSIAKKSGKTFIAGPVSQAPFPHSGYPLMLQTPDGLILHFSTEGAHWTANMGKTWTKLDLPGTGYYPKGIRLKDGKFIVIGHIGSDDAYGTVDQSVYQQSFKLRMVTE